MDLLQLMVTSMREGENEHGLPRWVSRGSLGREAAGIAGGQLRGKQAAVPVLPAHSHSCLLGLPIHSSPARGWWSPIPAEQTPWGWQCLQLPCGCREGPGVGRQRGGLCCAPMGYISRASWLPQCQRKEVLGKSDTGENSMLTDLSLCFILH